MTEWMSNHLLTFLVFAPASWGLLILCFPEKQAPLAKLLAIFGAAGLFFISAARLLTVPPDGPMSLVFAEHMPWFSVVGLPVDYSLSIDGLNLWLVMLTTFLTPLTMLGTYRSVTQRAGPFMALILILESGMLGAFMAQDLLFFYLFWEAMPIMKYMGISIASQKT